MGWVLNEMMRSGLAHLQGHKSIGDRYYSTGLRLVSVILVFFIALAYTMPQFAAIGLMFRWIMGIAYFYALLIGGGVVMIYTLSSSMLGVTKNMQMQYGIIANIIVSKFTQPTPTEIRKFLAEQVH